MFIYNGVYGIGTEGSIDPNVNDSIDSYDITAKTRLISEGNLHSIDANFEIAPGFAEPNLKVTNGSSNLDLFVVDNLIANESVISIDPTVIHSRVVESNLNFDKDMSNSVVDSSIASIEFKDVNSDMNNATVDADLEVSENSNSSSFLAVQAGFGSNFCESIDPSCPRDVSTGIGVNKQASNGILESENTVFQAQCDNSGLGKETKRCSNDEMQHYSIPSFTVNSKEQVRFLELDWNDKKNEHVDMVIDNKKPWVNSFQSNVIKSFAETIGDKSSTFNASIRHIPKVVGKKIGEVEMPYTSLMLVL
ncbi:hypothetical protein L1887_14805 [Cichorium endivia]|nr:hypothetical protein L1887_14805 [Cichorium endivia]